MCKLQMEVIGFEHMTWPVPSACFSLALMSTFEICACVQELYSVEHFALKTVAITFWRLPVIFVAMFVVRGKCSWSCSCFGSRHIIAFE